MKRMIDLSTKAILLVTFSLSLHMTMAESYKWVDENGNTVYSQSPPAGNVEYEVVDDVSKVDSDQALKKLRDDKIKAKKLRQERLAKEAERKAARKDIESKQQNCDLARAKLASLQRPRTKYIQPDGSVMRVDEEERQRQIEEAQGKIEEWCN